MFHRNRSAVRRGPSLAAFFATLFVHLAAISTGSGAPATGASPARPAKPAPRSAVLFIGDGMGPAYVTVTRLARGGSAGRLAIDTLPYTALARTYSADGPVTDSAAAATAMSCGRKTVNGVLGEDATAIYGKRDGARLEALGIWSRKHGIRVGIVTTARVTHATPAAFYACENNRDAERAIARQAIASPVDLLLGGGVRFFLPRSPAREENGWMPSDTEDLEASARARGWTIVDSGEALERLPPGRSRILGLFAADHMPYETPGAARSAPTLVRMTRFAIGRLKAIGDPFFLMVEGGRIDHAGHANWARTLIDETAAFDDAIGAALAMLDPKTTLVLVTADHETGGLAINGYPGEAEGILGAAASDEGGAPYPVLTFATGPGTKGEEKEPAPHGAEDPRPSGIALQSAAHTGVDVALYGWGSGAEAVRGTLDNTAIYSILRGQLEGSVPAHESLTRAPR